MKLELPTQTLLSVSIANDTIPDNAFQELRDKMGELYGKPAWANENSVLARIHQLAGDFPKSSLWRSIEHPDGSWVKRLSKILYENYKMKLSNRLAGIVGDIMGRYDTSPQPFFFEIDRYADWLPGAFGDKNNSCWWSSYNNCREGWKQMDNTYAVLFYKSEHEFNALRRKKGVGRSWLMHRDDHALIFNAYGISLSQQARILASSLNTSFRRGSIKSDGAYINSGNLNNAGEGGTGLAYFIGDDSVLNDLTMPQNIGDIRYKDSICDYCGKPAYSKSCVAVTSIGRVCQVCLANHFFTCNRCGYRYKKEQSENVYSVSNGSVGKVCKDCYAASSTCVHHGKVLGAVHRVWHTSREYCEGCVATRRVAVCSVCGRYADNFTDYTLKLGKKIAICRSCGKSWKGEEKRYEKA